MKTDVAKTRRALVLLDFQHEFLDDAGRMPISRPQVEPVLASAARAIEAAKQSGDLVVAIGNEFKAGDIFMNLLRRYACMEGSMGARWSQRLPIDDIPYFPKWAESAFVNPAFATWLTENDVATLALTGIFASACVSSTAKEALKRGYRVELIADAIACSSDRSRAKSLARLVARGAERSQAA